MDIKEIFEKVNLAIPIEQRRFFNYFSDTVTELAALYDGFVFEKGKEYVPPERVEDTCVVLPLYKNSIVDNILFMISGSDAYKSEFLRKSRAAYLKYWNDFAKGKKMRKAGRW